MTLGMALFGLLISLNADAAERLPRTVFIGDSQSCETMGSTLDAKLRAGSQGQTWTRGRWGTSPHDFYNGTPTTAGFFDHEPGKKEERGKVRACPYFPELLNEVSPGLVVVELGANLTWSINDPEFIKKTVGKMIDDIKAVGARCFWIGPSASRARPNVRELQAILLEAMGDRCAYFDSIPWTPYPAIGGDGLHFNSLGPYGIWLAQRWGEKAFEAIERCVKEASRGTARTPECRGF